MTIRPRLLLVLPDLGGIGKTTVAEYLVGARELAGLPVIAIDGDPTSRGLIARRAGRHTVPMGWKAEGVSQAPAIRNAVQGNGGVGVLDFGGGSTHVLSVQPTIDELCQTQSEVETIIVGVLEASKIGLASSVSRLMKAYPQTRFVLCCNTKSGRNWSSFTELPNVPRFTMPEIPVAITEFLTHYRLTVVPQNQEKQRPALVDLVQQPEQEYRNLGMVLASFVKKVVLQPVVQELLHTTEIPKNVLELKPYLVLGAGPMTNEYISVHQRAAFALGRILQANLPAEADEEAFKVSMGAVALMYVKHQAKLRALRESFMGGAGGGTPLAQQNDAKKAR